MCLLAPIPIHPTQRSGTKSLIGPHFQTDHLDITMIDDDSDEKQDKAIITKSDALDVFA